MISLLAQTALGDSVPAPDDPAYSDQIAVTRSQGLALSPRSQWQRPDFVALHYQRAAKKGLLQNDPNTLGLRSGGDRGRALVPGKSPQRGRPDCFCAGLR